MNRYINKELFLYLHQNNFMNWDFYILHYLYSFKYVRRIMSGIFSARNNSNNRILTPKNDIIFYNKENIVFNNNRHNIIDNNITIMTFYKKKFEYIFLFSDAINLNLFILKSYIMYAFFVNVKKPVIFEFHFNFIHMRILYIISLFDKLENFLKKLLYIKNGEINFDYSYFDIFAKMTNHNIKNYFHNIYLSKHENEKDNQIITCEKEKLKEKSFIDSISLKIVEPFIEVLTINEIKNNYKAIQSSIKLKKQFIEELIKNDINNWIEVIKKYKNEFGIKYHVKYEEAQNQKQKVRRKISIYDNINNRRFSRQSINNMKIE